MHSPMPPLKGKETHKGRGMHRGLCYFVGGENEKETSNQVD